MLKWILILGLTLGVSPSISFAPSTLSVKVSHINPIPEARLLVWSLVSDSFASESRWDLHGEDTPKTLFLPPWKDVPPGTYRATATIYDSVGNILQRAVTQVQVRGFE